MIRKLAAALLLTSALAAPAHAAPETDVAAELAAMRAKIAELEAEVKAMKAERAAAPVPNVTLAAAQTAPAPAPAAAPAAEKPAEEKVTIKPFGRLNYDVGYVSSPDGVNDRGLGFANELRRARIGVEGSIPGGFGYKFELDFADNQTDITDAILTWKPSKALGLTLGQHNNFQSLEELTSSRFLSFMERAAFTDAFGFERRIGLSATWTHGDLIAQGGVFTDNIDDLTGDENESVSLDARLVYAPKLGGTQLHLGGSAHWRDDSEAAGSGSLIRYRQRPMIHTSDTRFLATPAIAVEQETNYGLEAAMIRGPFHAAAEVHWLQADALAPGLSPTFFGGYAEAGFYLTGETRAYKAGKFDRTKVLKPVGKGGFGALQLNLRYDYLDLVDGPVIGGRQSGYQASLVWILQDHVRFLLNYGRMQYEEAAIAAAGGDTSYGIDVFGARAQVDF